MDSASAAAFPGLVTSILTLLVMAVALVLVATRARGRAKQLGVVGCAVLILPSLLSPAVTALVPTLAEQTSVIAALTVVNTFLAVVNLVGVGLLVAAVIVGSTESSAQPYGAQPPSGGPPVSGGWDPSSAGPPPR